MWKGVIREYREFYDIREEDHIATLLEGNTPLIPAKNLAEKISNGNIKDEQITQEVCTICQQVRDSCAVCGAETTQDCTDCAHT